MKNTIIIIILCVLFMLGIGVLIHIGNNAIYNNGICEKCNGHYEFIDCGGGKIKIYIYKCDTCGNMIQTTTLMNTD